MMLSKGVVNVTILTKSKKKVVNENEKKQGVAKSGSEGGGLNQDVEEVTKV